MRVLIYCAVRPAQSLGAAALHFVLDTRTFCVLLLLGAPGLAPSLNAAMAVASAVVKPVKDTVQDRQPFVKISI